MADAEDYGLDEGNYSVQQIADDIVADFPSNDFEVLTPIGTPTEYESGCSVRQGAIKSAEVTIEIKLVAEGCDPIEPLNGNTGRYASFDDAPKTKTGVPDTSAIGPILTFNATYTECTNECTDYPYTYALAEMIDPLDSTHPTLMLAVSGEDFPLRDLAQSLRHQTE